MNKILRLDTISVIDGSHVKEYTLPKTRKGPYVVDDSCFVPIQEAIKQLKTNQISSSEIETTYDFPNGKDNGMVIPKTRQKGYSDITEISTAIMEDVARATEELQKGRAKKAYQDSLNQKMSEINNSFKESGNTDIKE